VAAELRGYGWAGYRVGDRLGLVWAYGAERTRRFKFKLEKSLTRMQLLNVYTMSEKSMNKFAAKLHTGKPDFVRGYSGALNIFATHLLRNPQFKINPRAVFTSASTLLPNYRRTTERAFNAKVYDYYGCNEVSHIAAQCGQHPSLHVTEENIYLEIVDDKGKQVNPGEEGEILVTNLNSYDMPFIRYDLGDIGKRDSSFTCLKDFETVFEGLPISEFQIIQRSQDEIVVQIAPLEGYTQECTEFIRKNIKFRGSALINVELVDSIPLGNSGKIRHIVSKTTAYS
jgi:phenylacetate-CoA ligase